MKKKNFIQGVLGIVRVKPIFSIKKIEKTEDKKIVKRKAVHQFHHGSE